MKAGLLTSLLARLAIGAVFTAVFIVSAAQAAEAGAPAFIRMVGEWESVAVKADPPAILETMPALAVPHRIVGEPTEVQPGVHFLVEQTVGGKTQMSELTYVHDASAQKSFGVVVGGDGSILRGVIEHNEGEDVLRLYDADGDVVWTERNVWASPDLFNSESSFMYEGEEARVWFETRRKPQAAGD